jgi:hypothetical protein
MLPSQSEEEIKKARARLGPAVEHGPSGIKRQ